MLMNRRESMAVASVAVLSSVFPTRPVAAQQSFTLKYILGSSMYGTTDVKTILAEVPKVGATAIDLWPQPHGKQREQLDEIGEEAFAKLLKEQNIQLGCITQYTLGPFGLKDELALAGRLGCKTIVTGGTGPVGLAGDELKTAVKAFIEKQKPQLEIAEKNGVTIAMENHARDLFESPDALKWLAELRPSKYLAVALAPYHLPQDEEQIAKLIRDLGSSIAVFYAWQHGNGSLQKQPKEQELLQMPGRGKLNFTPILKALSDIRFEGWTEIFMHPFPRGIPILETTDAVTNEINASRKYLESCLSGG